MLEVLQGRVIRGIGKFSGTARVGGQVVAEAEMLCAFREMP
jgi:3-hydroxymyristoyl/3-hydroxydecanoyl-(acyl carrier protein) dehydratase